MTRRRRSGVRAAMLRVREYAGLEPGYTPITEILKKRAEEQMAKPGVLYPAKVEIETEMSRNSNYVEGLEALFKKHNLTGWQEPLAKLKQQLTDYDAWVTANCAAKGADRLPLASRAAMLSSSKATASTFLPLSSPRWRTRLSPRSRAR